MKEAWPEITPYWVPHNFPGNKPPASRSVEGQAPFEEEFRALGKLLERDAKRIMERWMDRAAKEQVHADTSRRGQAMNELLQMLQSLGGILQEQHEQALEHATNVARDHGHQRSTLGWEIVHVARDYEILHTVVLEHLSEEGKARAFSIRQAMVLTTIFERAMGSAIEAFSEITNRKLEQQVKAQRDALRQITLDLTEAEHCERQRLAKALHDDFQQILVATRMRLESVMRRPSPDPATLQEMHALLDQMLAASRDLSKDLHPAILETGNLLSAVKWLGEHFHERHNLKVNVELQVVEEASRESLALRRLIYDGLRELLFNIVKHGRTDQAWLRISEIDQSQWRFEVEDRGVGFFRMKPDVAVVPTGLGLSSLRRRIEQVGGTVEVDSERGRGTRISFVVPMQGKADGKEDAT